MKGLEVFNYLLAKIPCVIPLIKLFVNKYPHRSYNVPTVVRPLSNFETGGRALDGSLKEQCGYCINLLNVKKSFYTFPFKIIKKLIQVKTFFPY